MSMCTSYLSFHSFDFYVQPALLYLVDRQADDQSSLLTELRFMLGQYLLSPYPDSCQAELGSVGGTPTGCSANGQTQPHGPVTAVRAAEKMAEMAVLLAFNCVCVCVWCGGGGLLNKMLK